jgi:hypothetical protein
LFIGLIADVQKIVVFTLQQKGTKLFQYKNKQIISPSSSYYTYKTFIFFFLAGNPEGMESLMGFSGFGKIFLPNILFEHLADV